MNNNKSLLLLKAIKNKIENNSVRKYGTVVALLILYFILAKGYNTYLLFNNIITISIIIAFIYVNIIRIKFADKTCIKGFESIYFVLISIIILNIFGVIVLFKNMPVSYFLFLYSVQATLEYCVINDLFNSKKISKKNILINIIYSTLAIILFIEFMTSNEVTSYFMTVCIAISVLISIGTCMYTLENIITIRKKFYYSDFAQLVLYMFCILATYVGLLYLGVDCIKIAEIIITLKCIMLFKFYNYKINVVLHNSLEKISSNIELAAETKAKLNSVLKKRNVILNEADIMLKKSRDKNNKLVDSIYGGVFLFYSDKLQYINKKALKSLNINIDEVLGIDLQDFIKRYFCITLEDIKNSHNYISCIKMKHIDIEVEIFLTNVDKNSKILYIHDISEVSVNKEIRRFFEEYLEEDEIKKEFFSNISHELKTPINLIFSALQVNQIYLKENNMDGINKNRKIIKQNCLRLIRTINNFIDANKISEGYIVPDCKIYNVVELVENISMASNKYIKLIENTLIFDADEEEIYAECDKEMITRIVLNILSNSVKYGRKGGNIKVSVKIYMDDYFIIKVENDGLKINKETIPYIFDKFTKLNKAFNRLKEGSGLGLFLTKALVELQGGSIRLVSDDRGNEFIITMPRITQLSNNECVYYDLETNKLEEKIDVEFSDIYIE